MSSLRRKKLEKIPEDGKIFHARGSVGVTEQKWPSYQKQSTYLAQSPLKSQTKFFTDLKRTILNFIWKNKKKSCMIKELLEVLPSLVSRSIQSCSNKTA